MLRLSDTIRHTTTPDGEILLDVHHGQMFCLNVIGSKILELMQQGYDEGQITLEISKTYGVALETVRADMAEFIESLHKHHLLQSVRSAEAI